MASVTHVSFVDDLDGTEAEGTVEFGLDGKHYEIDLSSANKAKLMNAFAEFVAAARRAGRAPKVGGTVTSIRPKAAGTPRSDREQNQAIREWAQRQGMEIAERGRIPASIVEEFHAKGGRVTALSTPPRNGTSVTVSPEIAPVELTSTKPEPKVEAPKRIAAIRERHGAKADEDDKVVPAAPKGKTKTGTVPRPASLRSKEEKAGFAVWCEKHGLKAPRSGIKKDKLFVCWDEDNVDAARQLVRA